MRSKAEQVFAQQLGAARAALVLYAYRISHNPSDAEELTQETLLQAWQAQEKLLDPEKLLPWLRKICLNLWLVEVDKRCRRQELLATQDFGSEAISQTGIPNDQILTVQSTLARMPESVRVVATGILIEEKRIIQVAQELRLNPRTIRRRLEKARALLQASLTEENP